MKCIMGLVLLWVATGCSREEPRTPTVQRGFHGVLARPPGDVGEMCRDVGPVRVCWGASLTGAGCAQHRCLRPRTLPARAAPRAGWRCYGRGQERRCVDRAANASEFSCSGDACVQSHPRRPDDGEWECIDLAGVVSCRARGEAAGVPPGPRDRGWVCGTRRGEEPQELCVDLAPDLPGAPGPWRCRFDTTRHESRGCQRTPGAALVGGPCGANGTCPQGASCLHTICVPRLPPRAECWLDPDCGPAGRCRLGSCQ